MFKVLISIICVIGLIVLFMFASEKFAPKIEKHLSDQVQNVLNETKVDKQVSFKMDGRDLNVNGQFDNQEQKDLVLKELDEIVGIRNINHSDQTAQVNEWIKEEVKTEEANSNVTDAQSLTGDLEIAPLAYEYTFMLQHGYTSKTSIKAMTDTEEMASLINKRANSRFGADNLDLEVKAIKGNVPENWNNLLMQAILPTVKSFEKVEYVVNQNNVTINGVVKSAKAKLRQEKVISTLIPENFTKTINITVE